LERAESETLRLRVPKPVALTNGMTVTAGALYTVAVPDGTFDGGENVGGTVQSTPIPVGTGSATAGGGLSFAFRMPSGLDPGAHSLVLTGVSSGKTHTVAFSVAAGDPNKPVSFATDWVGHVITTPGTLAALFAVLLALVALGLLAWNLFWRRRNTPEAAGR
jgi:hypothetical protein